MSNQNDDELIRFVHTLKSENVKDRSFAARELGKTHNSAAVEPLIEALIENIKEFKIEASIAAAHALSEIRDERAIIPLIQALEMWPRTGYDGFMMSLSSFGEAAKLAILDIIKKGDKNLQQGAFLGLAALLQTQEYKQDFELLIADLENPLTSPDWAMGFQSAIKLGEIGDTRAVNPLIKALKHSNSEMRYQAALALGLLGDANALPALNSVKNDSEISTHSRKPVAEAAIKAIELIKERQNGSSIT